MSAVNSLKTVRVMAILQLCIAFTVIASSAGYPFMGEIFSHKSKSLLYHTVMGDSTLAPKNGGVNAEIIRERLERNRERFAALPLEQQQQLLGQLATLTSKTETSFWTKLKRSFYILAFELPAFERAWLFFSIIISILLLLRWEGAAKAAWILPLIVFCYAWNNVWYGDLQNSPPDVHLFPSEELIVRDYLHEPLNANIMDQQPQLLLGWKRYLIHNWTSEKPSSDEAIFEHQVEKGEFAFNVARLNLLKDHSSPEPFHEKASLGMLILYFMWNIYFVLKVSK